MSGYTVTAAAESAKEAKDRWALHLGALGILLLLIGVLFRDDIAAAVGVWWIYPAYSHCFLVIPISAWLIWRKREQLIARRPALAPKALWLIPLLAGVWLVGRFAGINEVQQCAVIGFVQIALLLMLGDRIYRLILFPAIFLFFAVPTGQYLIPSLQRFTTQFVDICLSLIGVPHYTEGTIIELTNGSFEIARACAGLRFLIATLALGALFAHLSFRKWTKIVLFLCACVVVPITANGFRVLGIILLAHATNNKLGADADHIIYGWGFFVVIMLLLLYVGSRYADEPAAETTPVRDGNPPASSVGVLAAAVCMALAMSAAPVFAWWRDSEPVAGNLQALTRPLQLHGWTVSSDSGAWHPHYPAPDAQLGLSLTQESDVSGAIVDISVAYFDHENDPHRLIAAADSLWNGQWIPIATRGITAHLGAVPIGMTETSISSGAEQRLVWSAYWVDRQFTNSALVARLLEFEAALTGDHGSAVIAVSTQANGTLDDARQHLARALGALGVLPVRLTDAARASDVKASQ